jgi:hypothetical protein
VRKLILILLFISFNLIAYNQVIKGTVFDIRTDSTICFASIYINGTFAGSLSDRNGNFELDISKNVSMPISISSIGYYSVTLTAFSPDKPLLVYLTPKVYEMKEVIISSESLARRKESNLNIFKNIFLGTTGNARNCEILNENDVTFNYDTDRDTLKAFASKPILIDNKMLGYKITYYLDRFEYNKKEKLVAYQGSMIFTEDLATGEKNKQSYERRRKEAYLGSRMHFFRALWTDSLESAGFMIKNSSGKNLSYNDIVENSVSDSLSNQIKFLKCTEKLSIFYNSRVSNIIFLKEKVYFDKDGYFDQIGMSISWEGQMMSRRVGDTLPYSYKPGQNQ